MFPIWLGFWDDLLPRMQMCLATAKPVYISSLFGHTKSLCGCIPFGSFYKKSLKLRIKVSLLLKGGSGFAPPPADGSPVLIALLKRAAAQLAQTLSLAVWQEKGRCLFSVDKCRLWYKAKGCGLYCLAAISTLRYDPLTLYPLHVTITQW